MGLISPGRTRIQALWPAGLPPPAKRQLSPAAERALAEAKARRAARDRAAKEQPPDLQGRGGLDPVRYGDWEVKGVASDF
jgi:hypothetical protein